MKEFLEKPLCVTGTAAEKRAKQIFTVILEAGFLLLLSATSIGTANPTGYAIYLAAGVEVAVFALLSRWVHPLLKSLPLLQYTLCSVVIFAMGLKEKTPSGFQEILSVLYSLLMLSFLLRASAGMELIALIKGDEKRYDRSGLYLLPLHRVFALDFLVSTFLFACNPREYRILLEFLTRTCFSAAAILLATPDCVYINVKRMARFAAVFAALSVCLFTAFHGLSVAGLLSFSLRLQLVVSAVLAVETVFLGGWYKSWRGAVREGRWNQHYLYKSAAGCNTLDSNIQKRNEYLLELGMNRDYTAEYARRVWTVPHHAAEIANIQQQLRELQLSRKFLLEENTDAAAEVLQEVEAEAVVRLCRLSDKYRFSNGFDRCPIDMLLDEELA